MRSIFVRLGLEPEPDGHRRAPAVLALRNAGYPAFRYAFSQRKELLMRADSQGVLAIASTPATLTVARLAAALPRDGRRRIEDLAIELHLDASRSAGTPTAGVYDRQSIAAQVGRRTTSLAGDPDQRHRRSPTHGQTPDHQIAEGARLLLSRREQASRPAHLV